ncbi:uncharacterized protein BDZ99DRAFT_373859 [Mytilinidion resinicola]|uniref:Uncharacterized protein n=1 Tax=Mytilinidion resinicola TaxID=574789 RepID=A0A6A6Z9K6_9PEZI|nr:uncharacterized protein BDZ99DRAFT_373859 [Mytilinidion resinicola]KAF2816964.1 hypothetical protein BDZ99DRAFT_373859 [Mytilinidion resinicola]
MLFALAASNQTYLSATALVTNSDNASTLECWQLDIPFTVPSTPGISGSSLAKLGNFTNGAYTVLPPRFNGGIHNAPVPQLVHFISGLAHVTLPHDPKLESWIVGGAGGLLLAFDVTGSGHSTTYPSDETTVAITLPFEGGRIPEHSVLAKKPCEGKQSFV